MGRGNSKSSSAQFKKRRQAKKRAAAAKTLKQAADEESSPTLKAGEKAEPATQKPTDASDVTIKIDPAAYCCLAPVAHEPQLQLSSALRKRCLAPCASDQAAKSPTLTA